jgi:hypothetical protein
VIRNQQSGPADSSVSSYLGASVNKQPERIGFGPSNPVVSSPPQRSSSSSPPQRPSEPERIGFVSGDKRSTPNVAERIGFSNAASYSSSSPVIPARQPDRSASSSSPVIPARQPDRSASSSSPVIPARQPDRSAERSYERPRDQRDERDPYRGQRDQRDQRYDRDYRDQDRHRERDADRLKTSRWGERPGTQVSPVAAVPQQQKPQQNYQQPQQPQHQPQQHQQYNPYHQELQQQYKPYQQGNSSQQQPRENGSRLPNPSSAVTSHGNIAPHQQFTSHFGNVGVTIAPQQIVPSHVLPPAVSPSHFLSSSTASLQTFSQKSAAPPSGNATPDTEKDSDEE